MAIMNLRAVRELETRHRLDRYLAPQVVDRILSEGWDALDIKQRVVITICFINIKDFTPTADKMHPEKLTYLLNEYLSEMAQVAFFHGGTVDKFIGDALMILFGAPVPSEPPEQVARCVSMAVNMQRRMHELNRKWSDGGLIAKNLACRIGIHTGEATVGNFGSPSRVDYTAIGSSVNLASRLEGICTPGKIMISSETRSLLCGEYMFTVKSGVKVKGFSEPVQVCEIDPAIDADNQVL
jgi:class 3 adenylate cyclase